MPFYRFYGDQLAASRAITHADRDTLANYASSLAEIALLSRNIGRVGFKRVVEGPSGVKTNPIVTQHDAAQKRARALAQDLGLTPASRGRVQPAAPTAADPAQEKRDAFFARPRLVKGA